MTNSAMLAIDQGTTNTKALLVGADGKLIASRSVGMTLNYPKPGWAEQCADEVWQAVKAAIEQLLDIAPTVDVAGIAISNQRETTVLWDAATGKPVGPAVSWQCRRSADICESFTDSSVRQDIEARSGLTVDPMFPSGKLKWLLDNIEGARERAERGELRFGTIDSWLLWQLTAGQTHATDFGNASRTQLFNLESLYWDPELLRMFNVPNQILPTVVDSAGPIGVLGCEIRGLTPGTPILAMMGDSHAALYAHGIETPGRAKVTIGTGSSIMTITDSKVQSSSGLSSTIAWGVDGKAVYALEGNILVAGNAARFMTTLLGLEDEVALTELAKSVANSDGVTFVPALAGLGAPHWKPDAQGLVDGLSLGTGPGHIARATLEAIAHQVADVVGAMDTDRATPLASLSVDGGASRNEIIMQALACFTDKNVSRVAIPEASAMGAAKMAFGALGVQQMPVDEAGDRYAPGDYPSDRMALRKQWAQAVERLT